MGKRFTDTEKWSDPWYRKLPVEYKNFWDYLCARCDGAGVWKVDMELAQFQVDRTIHAETALKLFESRVRVLTPESWHITGFIAFQVGELSPDSKPHQAIAVLLKKHQIIGYPKGMDTLKDKEKEKDKDSSKTDVKDKGSNTAVKDPREVQGHSFEAVWTRYPRKLGRKDAERHFKASVKTPQDYADLQNALDCFTRELRKEGRPDDKIPYGSTWFNNWRDWINYGGVQMPKPPAPKPRPPEPPAPDLTEDDMREMHSQKVATLGPCRDQGCPYCAKEAKAGAHV